jgi:hypothetical protein
LLRPVPEVEIAIKKLKGHVSAGSGQIPAELIHKIIHSIWNNDKLPQK